MIFRKTTLLSALAAIALAGGIAYGAGYFPNFPVVGGASYCGGFATGTTGQVCTSVIPAGPTNLAGTEYLIADVSPTTASSSPQTVAIPLGQIGGSPVRYITASTIGGSVTMSPQDGGAYLIGTGTVTTATTITLPQALYNNQRFLLASNVTWGALTISAATGYSVTNAPNGLTPITGSAVSQTAGGSYGYAWIFRMSDRTWYRIQ